MQKRRNCRLGDVLLQQVTTKKELPTSPPPQLPLRDPKYHLIKTISQLIEVHGGGAGRSLQVVYASYHMLKWQSATAEATNSWSVRGPPAFLPPACPRMRGDDYDFLQYPTWRLMGPGKYLQPGL